MEWAIRVGQGVWMRRRWFIGMGLGVFWIGCDWGLGAGFRGGVNCLIGRPS